MKRTSFILTAVLVFFALAPISLTNAASVEIAIGDQPYYTHGAFYVENGVRWEWVPGHWAYKHHNKVWVHGHYARR